MARPRLTGGQARGRTLVAEVPDGARPTSARVREALFSIVGQDLTDLRVLDAFAGSGLLGFEAWSRGARVVMVERRVAAIRAIRRNAAALGAQPEVRHADVLRIGPALGRFDGVLLDPPYADDPVPALAALGALCDGWLTLETDARRPAPELDILVLQRRRCYGGTALCVYRRRA